ncbi:hypothetical protein M885DRAFT_454009, partial [Pelagophyceae sp. CCMP2097]
SARRRRGKWTPEEERFVERVIQDFISGKLAAAPGTTLRNYLSEKLHCDPMRITKKFTGGASIGKRVYQPCERASQAALECVSRRSTAAMHRRASRRRPRRPRRRARRECLELEVRTRACRWPKSACATWGGDFIRPVLQPVVLLPFERRTVVV